MITTRALVERNPKTLQLIRFDADETPRSIQLYGVDPAVVGAAVRMIVDEDLADHVDLNFGCPVPKVTRKGGGSALPWRIGLFDDIVRAAVREARGAVPVTVKMRVGIDADARHLPSRPGCGRRTPASRTSRCTGARPSSSTAARPTGRTIAGAGRRARHPGAGQRRHLGGRRRAAHGARDRLRRRGRRPRLPGPAVAVRRSRRRVRRPAPSASGPALGDGGARRCAGTPSCWPSGWARSAASPTSASTSPGTSRGSRSAATARQAMAQASSLAELDDLLAGLDLDQPFPAEVLGQPRGRTSGGRAGDAARGLAGQPRVPRRPVRRRARAQRRLTQPHRGAPCPHRSMATSAVRRSLDRLGGAGITGGVRAAGLRRHGRRARPGRRSDHDRLGRVLLPRRAAPPHPPAALVLGGLGRDRRRRVRHRRRGRGRPGRLRRRGRRDRLPRHVRDQRAAPLRQAGRAAQRSAAGRARARGRRALALGSAERGRGRSAGRRGRVRRAVADAARGLVSARAGVPGVVGGRPRRQRPVRLRDRAAVAGRRGVPGLPGRGERRRRRHPAAASPEPLGRGAPPSDAPTPCRRRRRLDAGLPGIRVGPARPTPRRRGGRTGPRRGGGSGGRRGPTGRPAPARAGARARPSPPPA